MPDNVESDKNFRTYQVEDSWYFNVLYDTYASAIFREEFCPFVVSCQLVQHHMPHCDDLGGKNLEYQQRVQGRKIAIVSLSAINWPVIRPYVTAIVKAVDEATPGTYKINA